MKIVSFSSLELRSAIDKGEIVSFPTETVYGLGIRWDDPDAFLRLASVKKRAVNKPVSLMCSSSFPLDEYFYINEKERRVIDTFLPGPLTILLKVKKNVPFQVHLGTEVAGLRIPQEDNLLSFLSSLPYPLQVTSANLASEESLTDFEDVKKTFENEELVTCLVKGECKYKLATTIVSLADDKISLIRQGNLSFEEVKKVYEGEI